MAENSRISWTTHTFNPWIGCTNVGPGCDHCYAEKLATTRLGVGWGNDAPRRRTAPSTWAKVKTWHRGAEAFKAKHGHYPRVFAASLADIFDNQVDENWRTDFWALVKETPRLQWLIVTKRIGNVAKMLPPDWDAGYPNVVLIITVVNQEEADRDIPKLLATPARYRGLSIEPMLGPIDLDYPKSLWPEGPPMCCSGMDCGCRGMPVDPPLIWKIDWVITGGETKQLKGARPLVDLEAEWIASIEDQCAAAGVPHHFKAWGASIPLEQIPSDYPVKIDAPPNLKVRVYWREGMGRAIGGIEHNGFPPQ